MAEITLVATLKWGDDARIGMRALYKGGGGQYWGYIQSIEVYSDGTELWRVIEIGGAITVDAVSDRFELMPGGERDFSLSPVRMPKVEPKLDLNENVIYELLLEAFDLQQAWRSTHDRRSHKAFNAIGILLSQGTTQHAKIENEFMVLLQSWAKDEVQHKQMAMQTAQKIAQLRSL